MVDTPENHVDQLSEQESNALMDVVARVLNKKGVDPTEWPEDDQDALITFVEDKVLEYVNTESFAVVDVLQPSHEGLIDDIIAMWERKRESGELDTAEKRDVVPLDEAAKRVVRTLMQRMINTRTLDLLRHKESGDDTFVMRGFYDFVARELPERAKSPDKSASALINTFAATARGSISYVPMLRTLWDDFEKTELPTLQVTERNQRADAATDKLSYNVKKLVGDWLRSLPADQRGVNRNAFFVFLHQSLASGATTASRALVDALDRGDHRQILKDEFAEFNKQEQEKAFRKNALSRIHAIIGAEEVGTVVLDKQTEAELIGYVTHNAQMYVKKHNAPISSFFDNERRVRDMWAGFHSRHKLPAGPRVHVDTADAYARINNALSAYVDPDQLRGISASEIDSLRNELFRAVMNLVSRNNVDPDVPLTDKHFIRSEFETWQGADIQRIPDLDSRISGAVAQAVDAELLQQLVPNNTERVSLIDTFRRALRAVTRTGGSALVALSDATFVSDVFHKWRLSHSGVAATAAGRARQGAERIRYRNSWRGQLDAARRAGAQTANQRWARNDAFRDRVRNNREELPAARQQLTAWVDAELRRKGAQLTRDDRLDFIDFVERNIAERVHMPGRPLVEVVRGLLARQGGSRHIVSDLYGSWVAEDRPHRRTRAVNENIASLGKDAWNIVSMKEWREHRAAVRGALRAWEADPANAIAVQDRKQALADAKRQQKVERQDRKQALADAKRQRQAEALQAKRSEPKYQRAENAKNAIAEARTAAKVAEINRKATHAAALQDTKAEARLARVKGSLAPKAARTSETSASRQTATERPRRMSGELWSPKGFWGNALKYNPILTGPAYWLGYRLGYRGITKPVAKGLWGATKRIAKLPKNLAWDLPKWTLKKSWQGAKLGMRVAKPVAKLGVNTAFTVGTLGVGNLAMWGMTKLFNHYGTTPEARAGRLLPWALERPAVATAHADTREHVRVSNDNAKISLLQAKADGKIARIQARADKKVAKYKDAA